MFSLEAVVNGSVASDFFLLFGILFSPHTVCTVKKCNFIYDLITRGICC